MEQAQIIGGSQQARQGFPLAVLLGAAFTIACALSAVVMALMFFADPLAHIGADPSADWLVKIVLISGLVEIALGIATLAGRLVPYYVLTVLVGINTLTQVALGGGERFPSVSLLIFVLLLAGFRRFQQYCAAKRDKGMETASS